MGYGILVRIGELRLCTHCTVPLHETSQQENGLRRGAEGETFWPRQRYETWDARVQLAATETR